MNIELFADGACKGNPGPGGYGVILKSGTRVKELKGGEPHTTNNRMELMGVIRGLQELKRSCHINVTTDSQYVRKGITEWIHSWKKNNWKTSSNKAVANQDLWELLLALSEKHTIKWHWVKGHSGHPENERCDDLANEYIQRHYTF